MEILTHLGHIFLHYVNEIWVSILLGFILSGIINEFVPSSFVERYLSEKGWKPLLLSSFCGTLLPVCCVGSLPIAITMKRKGARLGPVLAFLVTTPATSISALLVTWRLLGTAFTVYIFFSVIIIGLLIGWLGNCLKRETVSLPDPPDCCEVTQDVHVPIFAKFKNAMRFAFIQLPKEIGLDLLIGILVASFILSLEPLQQLIHSVLQGWLGYLTIVIISHATYVCSTANVALADALIRSGVSPGLGICYLIIGPITSYSTFLVLARSFGWGVMWAYIFSLSFLAVLSGLLFDFMFRN